MEIILSSKSWYRSIVRLIQTFSLVMARILFGCVSLICWDHVLEVKFFYIYVYAQVSIASVKFIIYIVSMICYLYVCIYIYVNIYIICYIYIYYMLYIYMLIYKYIYMYVYIYVYVYVCIYICMCMYMYVCMCIYAFVYI